MRYRDALVACFQDTQQMYESDNELKAAALWSREHTVLIQEADALALPNVPSDVGNITITKRRTFESAEKLLGEYPDKLVAVLNFASPVNPGGGVVTGSSAQEECLCRCSTLYPCLDQRMLWNGYYLPNRISRDSLSTDACIYTPRVKVFKSDERMPEILPKERWYDLDVITCAAPNLRRVVQTVSSDMLRQIHVSRARRIMSVAASRGVRVLVLGAFGCGAFRNDPRTVASAWHQVVTELGGWFDAVEFAVWCPPHDSTNYDAFVAEFNG